jgi:hypothetical protein
MRRPASALRHVATSDSATPESDLRGCLLPWSLMMIPVWIMIYPHPYWLVVGFGFVVPIASFVLSRINDVRRRFVAGTTSKFNEVLVGYSAALILALVIRAASEFALLEVMQYIVTALLAGAALTLVAQACKAGLESALVQLVSFTLYAACVLALANTHLDISEPAYTQGKVSRVTLTGIKKRRDTYFVAPYLTSDYQEFKFSPWDWNPPEVGDPVCSVRHAGRFGFPWYERRRELCPATINQTRK